MFKKIIRSLFSTAIGLFIADRFIKGVHLGDGAVGIILASVVFSVTNLLIKPLVSLLFLPINFISMGLLGWIVNVIVLFVFTQIFPTFSLREWHFEGWEWQGFIIPAMNISVFWTAVLTSIVLSTVSSFFHWLYHEE